MKRMIWMLAAVAAGGSPLPGESRELPCHQGRDAAAIEARRAGFNDAIRSGDLRAVEAVLAEDVVLVAGTHSDRFLDRSAQLEVWAGEFEDAPDRLVYLRTPTCIRLSRVGPMAIEHGTWRGQNDADDFAAGAYTAKWRRIGGEWRIEAEVFMTTDCGGAGCPEPAD